MTETKRRFTSIQFQNLTVRINIQRDKQDNLQVLNNISCWKLMKKSKRQLKLQENAIKQQVNKERKHKIRHDMGGHTTHQYDLMK